MSSLLKKLEDNRTAILLAELGAYLHDLGKARKEFVEHYAENVGSGWDGHNFPSKLPNNLKELLEKIKVEICNEHALLLDFIEKHHKEKEGDGNLSDCDVPPLIRLLYAGWNGYDGMDSGLDKGSAQTKQKKNNIFISTAFGYEPTKNKIENNLIDKLDNEIINHVIDALQRYTQDSDVVRLRRDILKNTEEHYLKFLGETRRPANDVTLWDHSYSVASLYKCAIVKNIIDCSSASFDPLDFRWKILSINLSVLSVLAKSIKIGDVLGYKEKIDEAFREIKTLIELTYPIGNEIYRDTTGIYFIIPDIEVGELKEEILKKLKKIEPEFMAEIIIKEMSHIEVNNYKFDCINQTQIPRDINSQRKNLENVLKENLKRILPESRNDALKEIPYPTSNNRLLLDKFVGENWDNKEVCPICRFRPMKENSDGCEHCLKRRKSRAENWIENSRQTIWLDEVSDHNDRVALLIGSFILDNWLDGTLVKTFAINKTPESKNPSPARIRRCWETTQDFIQTTIFESILDKYPFGANTPFTELRRKRIQITIESNPEISKGATLDIDIDGVRLSPVYVDKKRGLFLTETNLQILTNKGKTLNEIALWMQGKNIKVKKEGDNKWRDEFKISMAKPADGKFQDYIPCIKIYDYPDQFMALVPASDAFDIAKKIFEEYEIQFSKVRDRLPFHIGIIAFHKRTPLYVAMDAGKRLIEAFKNKTKTINATIDSIDEVSNNELGKYVRRLKLNPAPCYSSVPIIWHISYSTGDLNQQDEWHPYIRFNGDNPNRENYSFDYNGNGNYVVHVKELKAKDRINIETSYLRLSFLENASDRFRIGDDLRPLDDIKRMDDIWNEIQKIVKSKKLGFSQLYAYWEEVKKRYKDYRGDSVWENFVKSSLINILKLSPEEEKEVFDKLFQATKDGLLDICLQWHLRVRKIKPAKTQEVKNE